MTTAKRLVTFVDIDVSDHKVPERAATPYGAGWRAHPGAEPGFQAVDTRRVKAEYVTLSYPDGRQRQVLLPPEPRTSVTARHELELTDGHRVLLLNDRGWPMSRHEEAIESVEFIKENARRVVAPEPPDHDYSDEEIDSDPALARRVLALEEEEAKGHWAALQHIARRQGVIVDADELRALPHDVVIGQRLLARIGAVPDGV